MITAGQEHAEAVLFFEQSKIVREMLNSEFDAILDGFIPIPEFSDRTLYAVYCKINAEFCVAAAVFFLIPFDSDGFADKRWNVPLQQLADNSPKGPDLGAGPIRLACASQCPIAWHQKNLWDPKMSPQTNNFVALKKAIKANRLGLVFKREEEEPAAVAQGAAPAGTAVIDTVALEKQLQQKLHRQYEQEFRDHMARQLKEQRLHIATLNNNHKQVVQRLQKEHQHRIEEFRQQLEINRQSLAESETRNQQLKGTIDGQAEKIAGVREYFEHKLKSAQKDEVSQVQALQESYDMELALKVEAASTELKEQLQMRDVELMYRNEQENSLREEIGRLQQEKESLVNNSGDQLLEKLSLSGISFVAFHPGAGHLTVPVDDMAKYLDNPVAFAAEKCGVSLGQYKDWLEHYQAPCCRAISTGGEVCGESIERVLTPIDFHPGENDRCTDHQTTPTQTFAAVRI